MLGTSTGAQRLFCEEKTGAVGAENSLLGLGDGF